MVSYTENLMYQKENPLLGQQAAQQVREAESILSEFSSALSNYANLLEQLTDRTAALCVQPTGNAQKSTATPQPCMSPIGLELSSRIASFDELNRRLYQLLDSLSF